MSIPATVSRSASPEASAHEHGSPLNLQPAALERLASVDILRAAAIALMVAVHFAENLSGSTGESANGFAGVHRSWWLPTGWAAPTFSFLTGVSYRIWFGVQRRRGRSDQAIAKATVRRGLFLVGLGFAFNVLIWLPEDIFNWDILTLIGCGMLTLEVARRMPDAVILLAALAIVAVAPGMRLVADYPAFWTAGYFDYDFTASDVFLGWLATGYFPVFPWLAFPLMGYVTAPRLLGIPSHSECQQDTHGDSTRREASPAIDSPRTTQSMSTLPAAAALVALAGALIFAWPMLPPLITGGGTNAWSMFPASTAYVVGTLGSVMMAVAVLHTTVDCQGVRWPGLVGLATPLSRHALSIYLVHHAVHLWPLWAVGLATTGEATALWQKALPVVGSLTLAAVFLVAATVLFRWMDRHRIPAAESLMRWVCD